MITIEPMTQETAALVAALEGACFSMPWSEKDIRAELDNPWAIWTVARSGGEFAGYLGIQYGPDGADIMNIASEPAFRRCGVAAALLQDMDARLQKLELQWITLEVRASNAPAIGLYSRCGYREVGRRKNYYAKPREDAILMTKYYSEKEAASC